MPQSGFKPRRVLIVDNERAAADTLATVIRMFGHEVNVAYDGTTALRVAEHFKPNLVLLDLEMPEIDGYETCRSMRAQQWGESLFIAAVTGWEDDGRSRRSGFDLHLVKPLDFDQLGKLLSAL